MLQRCNLLFLLFVVSFASAETFTVASQDFNYYPHYDFTAPTDKGFIWATLEAFSSYSGHKFKYQPMPVKRLQKELNKGAVDFIYPDNPIFHSSNSNNPNKIYSSTIVTTLGGTIVKPRQLGRDPADIECMSLPLGFTPQIGWQSRVSSGKLSLIEVQDSVAALKMLTIGRADAADVDYFVSQHVSKTAPALGPFTLDPGLPNAVVEFKLATIKHQALIEEFNAFLLSHHDHIEELKAHYGIEDPEQVLKSLSSSSSL